MGEFLGDSIAIPQQISQDIFDMNNNAVSVFVLLIFFEEGSVLQAHPGLHEKEELD